VLGFGAYTWLLRVTDAAKVGTYGFVNPVVALCLAWAVGDEPFSFQTVIAGMIVLAGVVLIWLASSRSEPSPAAQSVRQSAPPHESARAFFSHRRGIP